MSDPGGGSGRDDHRTAAGGRLEPDDRAALLEQLARFRSELAAPSPLLSPRENQIRALMRDRAAAEREQLQRAQAEASRVDEVKPSPLQGAPRDDGYGLIASMIPWDAEPKASQLERAESSRGADPSRLPGGEASRAAAGKPSRFTRSIVRARDHREREISARRKKHRDAMIADAESKGAIGFRPEELPPYLRGLHRSIELDHTGEKARAALASWPRRLRTFRKRVQLAALGLLEHERQKDRGALAFDAPQRYPDDLSAARSRRIIAYAHTIVMLSRKTTRPGFARLIEGYSRGALAQLSINHDTGEPCGVSYIFATSHDAGRTLLDDCGPMVALQRSGALLADQPPEHAAKPEYLGIPKPRVVDGKEVLVRNALSNYWIRIRTRVPPRPPP